MTCAQFERTSAYLDGELDARAGAESERHIDTCPYCQALVAAAGEASEALRGRAARLQASPALRVRIVQTLDAQNAKIVGPPPARSGRRPFWLGAASGVGAAAIAAGLALAVIVLPARERLATALIDDHIRALSSGQVIEIASSSHHTVKPWFAGRAPLSPPVTDLAAEGFPLAGGRVVVVAGAGGKAAVVVYRHGGHEIDLYVWPSRGAPPEPRAERRGYRLISWKARDLTLAAVSDMQADELDRFVHLVQAAGE